LLAILGQRSGEAVKYGVVGAVLGAAIGLVIPRGAGPRPIVETNSGNLSQMELQSLLARRQMANRFLTVAFEKVSPPMNNNPTLMQWWEQQLSARLFGFGRGREDASDDVIVGFLLGKEADDLGIVVSDEAINDYINRITEKRLKPGDYGAILKSLHVSESQVFDAIRGELRARLAMEMLMPRTTSTPEEYWEQYKKLGITTSLEVAAVPIDDFLAQAPKPTDEQLNAFFDQWKAIFPTFKDAPGLGQPRRVRVEYLEADFAQVEKGVAAKPVTDQEVKKYYEDHREEYRIRPSATAAPTGSTAPAASSIKAPTKPAAPNSGAATEKPSLSAPVNKSPAKAPEKKSAAPKGKDAKKSGASSDRHRRDGVLLTQQSDAGSWDGEPLEWVAYQPAASSPAPRIKLTPVAGKPATATKPAPRSPRPGSEPEAPALPEKKGAAKTSASNSKEANPAEQPEFRPLDEFLQREIRDQILRSRTLDVMKAKIQAAYEFLAPLREQLRSFDLNAPPKMSAEQRARALKDYAAKNGLIYVLMPPLSAGELHDSDFPIAQAAEPVDDPFEQRPPIDVLQQLFTSPPELVFTPYQAEDRQSHRFAYWKVEDIADHIPTLDEPGVRERATRAWKIAEFGQKKAKERAEQLAELVRKSKKPMNEALAGQTVSGNAKGTAVVVVPTAPFSWYTVPATAPRDLMPDNSPRLSTINGVKDADDAFMKTVFDDMHVGDVRVVPNFGPSVQYVVQIKTRHPADQAEMAGFRERFLKENLFGGGIFGGRSTYDHLLASERQQVSMTWLQQLEAKYAFKRFEPEEKPTKARRAAAG
jgi:hypothetical protein